MLARFRSAFFNFHRDEEGLESLQVVMIIAIAAMIFLIVDIIGVEAVDWAKGKWRTLKDEEIN
jgi:hypothetical protein